MTGDQKHPPKIYSMLNDFAFQWIFGRKGNEKLTISLLNAILQLDGDRRIDTLELLNPFNMRQFRNDKLTVVDVKARDFRGQWYNIEAQVHEHEAYIARTVFYVAKLYSGQARAGEDYTQLCSATGISILGFNLFEGSTMVHEVFEFRNRAGGLILDDTMALHYIDLTKFDPDKPRSMRTPFEKWLHVMKLSHVYGIINSEIPKDISQDEVILMAIAQHQQLNASEKMRRRMEERELAAIDLAMIKGAVLEKGITIGLARGKAEGKAEGKIEGKAETAVKLQLLGASKEMIMQATGFSEEDLQEILSNNN
jgi:predicted transposase/invertase (TIGR01784 family)